MRTIAVMLSGGAAVQSVGFFTGKTECACNGTKLFPFLVNLGPTRTYNSAMGGNASTGLGSADHHSLRDMKSMGADDRPTDRDEDTSHNFRRPKHFSISINQSIYLNQA